MVGYSGRGLEHGAWPSDDSAALAHPRPTHGPPRHFILTRGAAGCESRPEPDGLRSRGVATAVGTALSPPRRPRCRLPPLAAERAGEQRAFVRGRLAPHLLHTQRRGAYEAVARGDTATPV